MVEAAGIEQRVSLIDIHEHADPTKCQLPPELPLRHSSTVNRIPGFCHLAVKGLQTDAFWHALTKIACR